MLQAKSAQKGWEERAARTLGPEVIKRAVPREGDASSSYANPADVLADPALTQCEKRDVLQRCALDAYLIEPKLSRGLPVSCESRLDEVIDALIDLDDNKPAVVARDVPQPPRTDRRAA